MQNADIQSLIKLVSQATQINKNQLKQILLSDLNTQKNLSARNFPTRISVDTITRTDTGDSKITGQLISGKVSVNQSLRIQPFGQETEIEQLWIGDQAVNSIDTPQPIYLTFKNSPNVSLGNIISSTQNSAIVADQFEAHIGWLGSCSLYSGRSYSIEIGSQKSKVFVTKVKYALDESLNKLSVTELKKNTVGVCNFSSAQAIIFDEYTNNPFTALFTITDEEIDEPIGVGVIDFPLRRASNIHNQYFEINKIARADRNNQKPVCLWLTGLSGSGKSTIANALEKTLFNMGKHCYILDGDNVRHGLNKDLGFTEADRIENIRRVSEVAKLMTDAGLIVIVTLISPFEKDREFAKSLFEEHEFFEIFIKTSLDTAEKRDPKGLYKKARQGLIKNFTGIDSPYETPTNPNLIIDTNTNTIEESVGKILQILQ